MHKNGNNTNIGIRGFATWKQKNPMKNVTSRGNRTQASHNLWFQVQHYPFWTKLTFACKTETLGSLHSHTLLILTESSESNNQVVHEQKFKDLLNSTCQVSPERLLLDFESEVMRKNWINPNGHLLLLEWETLMPMFHERKWNLLMKTCILHQSQVLIKDKVKKLNF